MINHRIIDGEDKTFESKYTKAVSSDNVRKSLSDKS